MSGVSPFLEIPAREHVASNALAFAVRDCSPVSPGHTLVVPRRLVATWFEATQEEQRAILDLVEEVKCRLDDELHPDGYNVGFNAGTAAGQTVMHLHLHVIPRFHGDMDDPRGGVRYVIPSKGNYPRTVQRVLASGGLEDPFVRHLEPLFVRARAVTIVAAFVQDGGVEVLRSLLFDPTPIPARVRLLTGDYLHITQASALDTLLDWVTAYPAAPPITDRLSVEVRVFETEGRTPPTSFHPKSWRVEGDDFATAFVGSSNLSRSALRHGIEWNLRVDRDRDHAAWRQIVEAFDVRWAEAVALDATWIERYRRRIVARPQALPPGELDGDTPDTLPTPHEVQRAALEALDRDRERGTRSGLVVLATGLGKTLLAVLDIECFARELGRRPCVIMIAHREELLAQAARWFRCAAREAGRAVTISWYTGARAEFEGEVVLASVQKLSLPAGLAALAARRFDYAVVDEVHHASADSYRRILAALQAAFLLGLTATPDRPDGGDVMGLFGDHVFYRADLGEGIGLGHLVPFRYYGLKDTVSYEAIPWWGGRFDGEALAAAVDTDARLDKLWVAWQQHPGARTLVFCVSKSHATHVRDSLVARGVNAHTVFGDGGTLPRHEALRALALGAIDALVTVDLFNEGVDVPAVDRVVMLRPTESNVVFLQQLGRGLRRAPGKRDLTVIDFVGNHRVFLWKIEALLSLVEREATSLRDFLAARETARMPPGCTLDLELESKEILAKLLPAGRQTFEQHYDRHVESHGRRPTAGEMFRAGMSLDAIRTRDLGWFDFVASKGHLSDTERQILNAHRVWLRELETTSLTKSFKMVLLEALLDTDALFEGMHLDALADRCRERVLRDAALRVDAENVKELGDLEETSPAAWRAYWRKNPVNAWLRSRWFVLEGSRFVVRFLAASGTTSELTAMTAELVDLRLAQYRRRRGDTPGDDVHLCRVTWNQRDPILNLPEAVQSKGHIEARVDDGRVWVFRCMKAFCNVAHPVGVTRNGLPDLLRAWFGPTVGQPGTNFQVRFRRGPDGWWVEPVDVTRESTVGTDLLTCYPTLAAAAGIASGSAADAPDTSTVRLPVPASRDIFAVRASGSSMNGGRTPIHDGDWCVLRWMRGAAVEALRDRVVLVQTTTRDEGLRFQLKRLIESDGRWRFVSDAPVGPEFPADDATVVLARVERVIRPESLGPAVGVRLSTEEIGHAFGWTKVSPAGRIDGHRTLWIAVPGRMPGPDRVSDDGVTRLPGETAFVFTRAEQGDVWRYGGVAWWSEREALWVCEAVDHATWKAFSGGRTTSRTLPDGVAARVDAWLLALERDPGVGRVVNADGSPLRILGRSKGGGLRIDGGEGGFRERSVSRTDLAWVLLAADDVRAHGGVLDEARVNRLRYLDGTPRNATRWIDTGHALKLWRLAPAL